MPAIATELLVVVVLVDNRKTPALEHTFRVQPIPLDAVRIEKTRDIKSKFLARNHAADHALRL